MTKRHHHPPRSRESQPEDFFRNINIQFLIHELKGPLNVIEANIRMLLEFQHEYGRLTTPQLNALKRAMRSAAKLRSLTHSLLEVGSSQTGCIDLQRFNAVQCTVEVLVNTVETVVTGAAAAPEPNMDPTDYLAANGIVLCVSPEVPGIQLYQDKTKFCHILGNLIRNGLCFKHARLKVEISVKDKDLEICVSDDGPGIRPEDCELLFKRYAEKRPHGHIKRKGHGLGLASSRILARYLGGDICLGSQDGAGARFLLRLPLTLDDQAIRNTDHEIQKEE